MNLSLWHLSNFIHSFQINFKNTWHTMQKINFRYHLTKTSSLYPERYPKYLHIWTTEIYNTVQFVWSVFLCMGLLSLHTHTQCMLLWFLSGFYLLMCSSYFQHNFQDFLFLIYLPKSSHYHRYHFFYLNICILLICLSCLCLFVNLIKVQLGNNGPEGSALRDFSD